MVHRSGESHRPSCRLSGADCAGMMLGLSQEKLGEGARHHVFSRSRSNEKGTKPHQRQQAANLISPRFLQVPVAFFFEGPFRYPQSDHHKKPGGGLVRLTDCRWAEIDTLSSPVANWAGAHPVLSLRIDDPKIRRSNRGRWSEQN